MSNGVRRIFDVAAAAAALAVALPVMAAVAVGIRRSGSPALFRQRRVGLRGREFTVLKFRTMRDAAGPDGKPLPDEQRMTRLGAFLRRSSLDELPQLWNVLKGDMSLVGPRPLLPEYLPLYSPEQARRHEVKPGITGWAQVNGRNAIDWDTKLAMDVWYVDHRSLWLDLRILLMTVRKVLVRDGISQAGHATAEPFRGPAKGQQAAAERDGGGAFDDNDELEIAGVR